MLSFRQYISERISLADLAGVEKYADKLFKSLGIDVEFGGGGQHRSFLNMLNDKRNVKTISRTELSRLFKLTFQKHGKTIQRMPKGAEAVITDMETDINMPFGIKKIRTKGKDIELQLYTKTIMRKPNFGTSNKKFTVGNAGEKAKVTGRGSHRNEPQWQRQYGGKKTKSKTNRNTVVRGGHKLGDKYSDEFKAAMKARLGRR